MVVDYGTFIKDLKDKLVQTLKANATSFDNHVYADFVLKQPANPFATVKLVRDSIEALGPKETRHRTEFEVWVNYLGDHTETTLNTLLGYVGEIVDAIEANRTLGSSYISNTEITLIDYTFRKEESGIRHHVRLVIEIESLRNV